ncbi:hypothetical protein TL16_g02697 [Triparma laevis f. inornata]|uniref:Uncharacterized protein n=1 Tax=Triparma laevis f. inornata TaxID=1714386 RepID=A0A9W6ZUW3_9STRA|nr:hypothetical protein TL16_g02697 [Triparma laevis f. inornata]
MLRKVSRVWGRRVMKPRQVPAALPVMQKRSGLTSVDCLTLAKGFDFLSKTSQNDEDAVVTYLDHFPVIKDISEMNPALEDLPIFMNVRLADHGRNENGFAVATLASLASNLGVQLLLVFFQTRKQSLRRMFREMMYALTFAKPGVNVYHVMLGVEQEVVSFASPKVEMFMSKGIKLICEAIPGTIFQSYAYLTGSNQSSAALFSLAVSVFTTAFTSTGISFDKELDQKGRDHAPAFYGYVPIGAGRKAKAFVLMFCISACQLTAKALAVALCAVEGGDTVIAYLVGEMLLFFAYKFARGDFWYWVPIYGVPGMSFSYLARLMFKAQVDFTAFLHARHPKELGGSYWAFTILSTPIIYFYFGYRYLEYVESEVGKARELSLMLSPKKVYGMIGGVLAVQILSFYLFLKNIEPRFIYSFYSTITGNEQSFLFFHNHSYDALKLEFFGENKYKWKKIREEVVEWVNLKILE